LNEESPSLHPVGEGFLGKLRYTVEMKKIGIDCRLAGIRHAGIGRYTQNLVRRLPLLDPDIEWVLFFSQQEQAKQVLGPLIAHPQVRVILAPARHYSFAEQLQMPTIFASQHLDILHVPHFNIPLLYRGKLVITIHDLLWHEHRGLGFTTLSPWLYHLKYFGYRFVVSQAVRKATKIFVPAETIRRTLLGFYPHLGEKIVVTKEGVDDRLLQPIPNKKLTQPKVLFYLGSLYPHKNVKLVVDALTDLPEYELWIVGTRNVFQARLKKYVQQVGVDKQVKFLGYLTDDQLTEIYSQIFALVQPSFSEGFGLTGVEAMAMEVPVLASDIPIFREIYQHGVVYFDPQSVASFQEAVHNLAGKTAAQRQNLISAAVKIAKKYSWDTMAEQTVAVYKHLLK
jgi:glycosyltransferase involved in cell wall biosynthesis